MSIGDSKFFFDFPFAYCIIGESRDTLKSRNGRMPYCDDTPTEIIKTKFGISKAAFKRALGRLMKEGKVYQEDGWTILK